LTFGVPFFGMTFASVQQTYLLSIYASASEIIIHLPADSQKRRRAAGLLLFVFIDVNIQPGSEVHPSFLCKSSIIKYDITTMTRVG